MNYSELKRLDEETLKKVKEGSGPADECLCSVLAPPGSANRRKSLTASIKKAFGGKSGRDKGRLPRAGGGNSVDIPLSYTKNGNGLYTTKEVVKRKSSCGKCGCDDQNMVLNHSYANIRITSPDFSSICPCSSDCLPDKDKLANNIQVTIEHVTLTNTPLEETDVYSIESACSEDSLGDDDQDHKSISIESGPSERA